MLPHSEHVHSEQFDAILVTTNSTVYEQRSSSPLLPSVQEHTQHTQAAEDSDVIIMWCHPSRYPCRMDANM